MQAVRGAQQEPAIGSDRPRVADEMLERGGARALRVRPLRDLRELVRVARAAQRTGRSPATEQTVASDTCPASSTNRTSTASSMSARAQTQLVPPTTSQRCSASPPGIIFVSGMRSMPAGAGRSSSPSLRCPIERTRPSFVAASTTASSRFSITRWDWAVTPTLLPVRDQIEDHPGGRVGLAGAGGALDREHRLVESHGQRPGARRDVLPLGNQEVPRSRPRDPWQRPQHEVPCRAVPPRSIEPVRDHVVRQPEERAPHRLRAVRPGRDEGHRVRSTAPLEVHGPGQRFDRGRTAIGCSISRCRSGKNGSSTAAIVAPMRPR